MLSGGCQCGAVRFTVAGKLGRASLCHCRMCQKAFGGPFGALVSARLAEVTWTRGDPKRFASSNKIRRGFCGDCGTPLTFEYAGDWIDLSIFALDDPGAAPPTVQLSPETRQGWIDHVGAIPVRDLSEGQAGAEPSDGIVSNQHPDHDTETWPAD